MSQRSARGRAPRCIANAVRWTPPPGSRRHEADNSGLRLLRCEHELAVLDRDPLAGVVIHLDLAFRFAKTIAHVVAHLLLVRVVHRLAMLLVGGVRVALLHPILDAIACVAAGSRSSHRRQFLPVATADLVAEHATNDWTDDSARD